MRYTPTVVRLLDRHEMSKDPKCNLVRWVPVAPSTLRPYSAVEELGLDLDALGLAASPA
jgi:hypothetical protein